MTSLPLTPVRGWLCLLGMTLLLASSLPAAPAKQKLADPRQPKVANHARTTPEFESLPLIRSNQNQLLVRAYINGKAAWLGVDSGAPVSAISVRRHDYFKLTSVTPNSNLPSRVQVNEGFSGVAIVKGFRLGNLNLVDQPVVTLDLDTTRASRSNGPRMDGILGADILFPLEAVLDCQALTLTLKMNPDVPGRPPGLNYHGFSAIPMQMSEGSNLYVNATVNGTPAMLMVDTGAFATLLHRPFVRRLNIPTQRTRIVSAAVNLKEKGVQVARIRKLTVGAVEMNERAVGVTDLQGLIKDSLLGGKPPVAGLLGGEILNRNHAIIDFGTQTLYLKKDAKDSEQPMRHPGQRAGRPTSH